MKTLIEPFRIRMVEPIRFYTRAERENILKQAQYNLFMLHSDQVTIDLLTDSGTSAMSARQWAGMMEGDEAYAGSRSFFRFEKVFQDLTGYKHIIPTHQGRASERILFSVVVKDGEIVPSNSHFDTTKANLEYVKGIPKDLFVDEARDFASDYPFKGNMDVSALEKLLEENPGRIPLVMMTVTNNSLGGQPASLENLKEVSTLCRTKGIPFLLDACRFAENAYLIKQREKAQKGRTVKDIAKEMFSYADGCTFSAKKDAFANIGGMLAFQSNQWAHKARGLLILTEGFPTYGGLAGRDLEAIAIGVEEILDESYLRYRCVSTNYLGEHIWKAGVPIVRPVGGHAVFIDAKAFLPHIPPEQFPGQALACELYLHAGVRSVEIGSLMFGKIDRETKKITPSNQELLRLAIPRRAYTQSHIDYVVEAIVEIFEKRKQIQGLKIVEAPNSLRHFTAKLAPISK